MTIVNLQKQRMQHWSVMGAHSSDNCKLTKAKKATLECNGTHSSDNCKLTKAKNATLECNGSTFK